MKKDYIEKILEKITTIIFILLILVVFLQIFSRFCLPKSPSWTEEISRFLFVYSISFGAPLALKKGEYVKVDIIISKLPLKVQDKIDSIIYLFLSIFFILIGYTGYEFGMLGLYQTSPAMQLPMFIPYMSISISCIFLMIYSFYKAKERFSGKGRQDILEEILEKKEVNE